ncbi:hypothetical protein HELRODRAFT_160679 [Helobdella robusta]|uniref:Uncharacterized protein n=1 Tax=Helobdella robusta TaxID=6412 RepID=T1EQL2_HELRO|nr:hypothetical protein HELRODRAFT_160679 [Helobdella robusta]ESO06500.1 hypothetical protein HELRODRAFT_160679 [Helobdella robusta]
MKLEPSYSIGNQFAETFLMSFASYQILKTFPKTGTNVGCVMEELVFKAIVKIDSKNMESDSVEVHLRTNLKHLNNQTGEWHFVNLPYRGAKEEDIHVYGQVLVLIDDGVFDYIFRAKSKCEKVGVYYPGEGKYSTLVVRPPKNMVLYADVLRVPYMSQIIGPLWGGNEWSGIQSMKNGFTHIMCLAEELPMPFSSPEGRCFCQCPLVQGVKNPLNREAFKRAVFWIKRSLRDGYKAPTTKLFFKILVYSKHGFGRVGSVMVGFVMMENPTIDYKEALDKTFLRRPVLPHRGLEDICKCLFRKKKDSLKISGLITDNNPELSDSP